MDINILDHTCYLVERATVKDYLTRLFRMAATISDDQIYEYAAFLGSDYITNIAGYGEKKVNTFMSTWVGLSDEQKKSKLISFQVKENWSGDGPCNDYMEVFFHCIHAWKYAAAWKVISTCALSPSEAYKAKEFNVELMPLKALPANITWKDLLGFEPPEVFYSINSRMATNLDYFELKYFAQDGSEVLPIRPPVNDDGRTLPWGSYMNETIPLEQQSMNALASWLAARKIPVRSVDKREDLLKIVQKIKAIQKRNNRFDQPPVIPVGEGEGVGHYINWETLLCNKAINWCRRDDMISMVKRNIVRIDGTVLNKVFGPGQSSLRTKAKRYVKSGHYDMSTLAMGAALLNEGREEPAKVIIMTCTVSASLRSDVYKVYLVFRLADKSFIGFPTSRCECKNGRVFCSHMLGLMFVIAIIQNLPEDHNLYNDLVTRMPAPIHSLRGLLIPMSYAIQYN
jgi:hypothetical protein